MFCCMLNQPDGHQLESGKSDEEMGGGREGKDLRSTQPCPPAKSTAGGAATPQQQHFTPSGPPRVYILVKGETLNAHRQLLTQLNISKKRFMESNDWRKCDIIILFCAITSRLGANVKAAMTEASGYSDKEIILVLMYHTPEANHLTSGEEWHDPKIKLQVPVLFHETTGGLLECRTNDQAIQQIKNALKLRRKKKNKTEEKFRFCR